MKMHYPDESKWGKILLAIVLIGLSLVVAGFCWIFYSALWPLTAGPIR